MRKIYFSIVLVSLCALTNSVTLFAQIAPDRITFTDSSKITAIVKAVQPPQIQYNDYVDATQKEGTAHTVAINQVAYIQYANGRVERNADWQAALLSIEMSKRTALIGAYSLNQTPHTAPALATSYEQAFIPKINLTNLALGDINVGVEYTLNKNFSVEGYLGYAGQGINKGHFYVYENGTNYAVTSDLKSGGLFSDFAVKWYSGLHNQWLNVVFQTDYQRAAPHGWNLALREQFIAANTEATFTYDNLSLPTQTSKGTAVTAATTLCIGYQQSHIFKALTFETYTGLGVKHRTSTGFNIITPGGAPLEVIKTYDTDLLTFVYGITIGVDINAFKKNLK